MASIDPSSPLDQRRPQLSEDALYGLTGKVVRRLAPHTEADRAALALDFLCGFGVMAGNEIGPWPHAMADGAEHPARLDVQVVGDTARARKSTAFHQIRRLLRLVDPDFIDTRVLSGFGSGEAIIDDVAESPDKRLWLCEHEFSRVLVAAGREGSILSHIIRQAWDGDRLQVRTRKKSVVADSSHLSVLGHITLDELRANLGSTHATSGFLNRFLFACVSRSQLLPSGGRLEDTDLKKLALLVGKRLKETKNITDVTRSEKAERLWERHYEEMANDNPGGLLGAIVARSEAHLLRLSVVYALTDGSPIIKTQHLRAAWAMWSYCRESAAYVFGRGIVADTILAALVQKGDLGLSKTGIHNLFGRHSTAQDIDSALNLLEREDLIEMTQLQGKGRPQTRVRLIDGPQ